MMNHLPTETTNFFGDDPFFKSRCSQNDSIETISVLRRLFGCELQTPQPICLSQPNKGL
jgi:hypothetical protein